MIDTAYFLALFFIFLRITAYFTAVGMFFPNGTPNIFKAAFSLIVSYGIVGGVDYTTVTSIDTNYMIGFFAVSEVLTGLILGYITTLIFQALKFAGSWMDLHAGFSMISVYDPMSQTSTTLLGNLSNFIAMVFFFMIGGQQLMIKLLVNSIEIVPIGKTIVYQETVIGIAETIINFFALGVKIAVPLVIVIVITDVCLGLISRTVPTIPIMIFGMPIKNILSFVTYIILLPVLLKVIGSTINELPNIFQNIINLIPAAPIAFIFAGDDKTEEATPKKKADSRKKGQIARSKDVNVAVTMIACTLVISIFWDKLSKGFSDIIIYFLKLPMLEGIDNGALSGIGITVISKTAMLILPFVLPLMLSGIVASILQSGFMLTGEPLKPSFGKLNPLSGLKNMISARSLVDLSKNLVVITIITMIAYKYMYENYPNIISMTSIYMPTLGVTVKNLVLGIFKKICIALVIIGAIDYFIKVKMHNKDLKMSKQEVKDEFKQSEGDPQIKGKIKQKQREMSRQRMMNSVADATVVITNPTHLAIALKYEEGGDMEAPKVVAKGADYLALKIKTLAKEHEVPIVENKPLARLMYDRVEIDDDIPPDLYQGVAEILAVVMKLKK